ncbi:Dityrosine transporter 1 [Entomophthora muscae]|uniref:Dityrosine transporter 1 n=1 Tax=Entomophthora muscae TaxID=34485 RepID=A0ACC2TAU4_9FUNG|nr:Dityrosine transporter 1 [Entomophthora muscae]
MGYTSAQRRGILLLVTFAGLLPPLCSTSYLPAIATVAYTLETDVETTNLSISSFLLTMAVSPLVWGTVSDNCGRRSPMLVSSTIFFVASVGCSVSFNVEMLILLRILQGIGASGALVIGLGVVSDMYSSEERGSALGMFYIGPLLGPIVGPLLGGFINHHFGWKVIFWLITSLSAISSCAIYLLLPETLNPKNLLQACPRLNPFEPLNFLRQAKVALPAIYSCIVISTFYAITVSQSRIFEAANLNSWHLSLVYLPLGISDMLGSLLGGIASDRTLQYARLGNHVVPESRLLMLFFSIPFTIAGVNAIGWLAQCHPHFPVIILAQAVSASSMSFSFGVLTSYVLDHFPNNTSSIAAACNLLRSLSAAITTSLTAHLINHLGMGWSFFAISLLHFIGILIPLFLTPQTYSYAYHVPAA